MIQFLQLLNGGDLKEIREGNTLKAITALEATDCLTDQEKVILDENYCFLRKVEHRLQFMFDLQTHTMPTESEELHKLALRMDYRGQNGESALQQFEADYQKKTELNRTILDHLLHDAFPDDPEIDPVADLILDPDPSEEKIERLLSPYPFQNPQQAYRILMGLGD